MPSFSWNDINDTMDIYNDSMTTYVDNTFIPLSSEGDLNVNHSDTSGNAATATALANDVYVPPLVPTM